MGDWDHPDDDEFSDDLERRSRAQIDIETTFWLTLIWFVFVLYVAEMIKESV